MAEFHNLAELALNREGQSWGNLGYWQSAIDYSDACRTLALLLGEEAGLDHRSLLFDAGFGCGDQLLLWLDHFRVGRVDGVNLSRSQTAYARARLEKAGHPKTAAAIVCGDVDDPEAWSTRYDREAPSHVLALDCAYHFPSRVGFFALAHQQLAPGGRLALTDLMLADQHDTTGFRHRLLRWMLKLSHIAEANIVDEERYRLELRQSGFECVRITDISEHVLPGLARFMEARHQAMSPSAAGERPRRFGLVKYRVTGRFLEWAYRRSVLRYCVISARKTG